MIPLSTLASTLVANREQSVPARPERIAVLIPCYNEEAAIPAVVRDFHQALPEATIYVYDNNSKDKTIERAREAGALVRTEPLQGKGNVVRRMFADVEADIYVMVDGDDTYDAFAAPKLIDALRSGPLDMVAASRISEQKEAYRPGHRLGNQLLTGIVRMIFGNRFHDMLTGYRVMSRRFVKSFPALSTGFEIETELTIHALELRMPLLELPTHYKARPPGSVSKLRTYSDGLRILKTIVLMVKEERPLPFFSSIAALLAVVSILLAVPLVTTFMHTGLVPRFPTAILCTGLMLLSFLSLTCGLLLDSLWWARRELKRMHYLSIPGLPANEPPSER